jgi:hypothetical protein
MSDVYDDLVPKPEPKPVPEPEESPVKSIFKSKTIWANLIGGGVALLTALTNSDLVADNPEYAAYAATAMAVLNLVLRMVTKEPVKVG